MYNNSYKRPKVALKAQDIRRSKGKSCGYYLRVIFFFSSLIQSLIIVSLVLFLVYGQPEKSPDEKRVAELEQSFYNLTTANAKLKNEKVNLTATLKTRTTEKDAADKKVLKLTAELEAARGNVSKLLQSLSTCNANKMPLLRNQAPCPVNTVSNEHARTLQSVLDQQRSLYSILQTNFTQTVQSLKLDLDSVTKEKNRHQISMAKLREEKSDLTSELQLFQKKCKDDFMSSLQGIQDVTTAFLTKIDNFFPDTFTFHLTCSKQQEQMRKIHANCTNLSHQVEEKFQSYLNAVGDKVSALHGRSSRLEVENKRVTSDFEKCRQERSQEAQECTKLLKEAQETQDRLVEQLLNANKQLLQEKQILQATCSSKPSMPKPDSPYSYGQSRPGSYNPFQSRSGSSQPPKQTT